MRPEFRPAVERLESYRLMTGLAIPAVGPSGFTLPAVNVTAITRPATAVPLPVTMTLATDRSVYTVGQPVRMTLTETNNSSQTVQIGDGPSVDGFFVSQNGATVWRSNAGIQPFFIRLITLAPGQSFTLSATWDGHPNNAFGGGELTATPTGTFVIHSQVIQSGASADPVTITIVPATTLTPTPTPTPTPTLSLRVSTDRASYAMGQPVTLTVTETNTGGQSLTVGGGGATVFASAAGPKGPVWLGAAAEGKATLRPGQSRTFTLVWDGRADLAGSAAKHVAGAYTVQAGADGKTGTATFVLR